MGMVPSKFVERIGFYESHIAPFTTNATAIGTTTAAVTDLETKTEAARAALSAQEAARDAARTATINLKLAVAAMSTAGAAIIDQVRAKAKMSGDSVWGLANLPLPSTPSPVPPPGTPANLVVKLMPDGSLELKWKCPNPPGASGTIYYISRRTGTSGPFVPVGTAGARKFVDATVPAGTPQVTYSIVAERSTSRGPAQPFIVNFGVGGGGEMTASVADLDGPGGAPKLAA